MNIILLFLFATDKTFDENISDIYHPFDLNVKFSQGNYIVKQHNDGSFYTMCIQKQTASQQSVLLYNKSPKPVHYEKVLKKVIPGSDGRKRVEKTAEWPYCVHGHMDMLFISDISPGLHAGSGILVGPHHFLTCAHNVYHDNEWAKEITIYLGLDNDAAPYGAVEAVGVYVYLNWLENEDPNYDIALVILKQSIGKKTGWAGLLCADTQSLAKKTVEITGYPADKSEDLKQMWTMAHRLESVYDERMAYLIDTFYGQSGSGICHNELNSPFVVGIHTNGPTLMENSNSGVRLTFKKFIRIVKKWMSETAEIQDNHSFQSDSQKAQTPQKNPTTVKQYTEEEINAIYFNLCAFSSCPHHWPKYYEILQKLSDQGNPIACYCLGDFVARNDPQKGIPFYQTAAAKGYTKAQFKLYKCFLNGKGVMKSLETANSYLDTAAENGYIEAVYKKIDQCKKNKDEVQLSKWFLKGAEYDDRKCQYEIGRRYLEGIGIEEDEKIGFNWLYKSGDCGNTNAILLVAQCYEKGQGTTPDFEKAKALYYKLAEADNEHALFWMGQYFDDENNTDYDPKKAKEYYKKALTHGHPGAREKLNHKSC